MRVFKNQNEITNLGISPISIVEEMAKDIRELRSEKKNLMVFDDLLLEK